MSYDDSELLRDMLMTVLIRQERTGTIDDARALLSRADRFVTCDCEDSSHDDAESNQHEYQQAFAQWNCEGGWNLCAECYVNGHCLIDRD